MTDTKPTKGAFRAAKALGFQMMSRESAELIDRESGLRELVEAAEIVLDSNSGDPGDLAVPETDAWLVSVEGLRALQSALARVKGES